MFKPNLFGLWEISPHIFFNNEETQAKLKENKKQKLQIFFE